MDFTVEINLDPDVSYGRIFDGNGAWTMFSMASPYVGNGFGVIQSNIEFSHEAGKYETTVILQMTTSPGLDIYYTTDGSEPNSESMLYNSPLWLDRRDGVANGISTIASTIEPFLPIGEVDKINVIRARAFSENEAVSPIYTRTYMIESDTARYSLPIFSISTDPDNLFNDSTGIYVVGAMYDSTGIPNYNRRGIEWERPIHLELIDENGNLEWEQGAGIRMHGHGARHSHIKSFKLYGRSEYGNKYLDHPVLPNRPFQRYERLLLRTIRSHNGTFFIDELGSWAAAGTDIDRLDYRPVVVFINGEFWGVSVLKERPDHFYVNQHYDYDTDSIDLLTYGGIKLEGSTEHYDSLLSFIDKNDLAITENYEYIQTQMDVSNYIEYLIHEFYFSNLDWPYNNIIYFRPQTPDGRWRWIMYDLDVTFKYTYRRAIENFINSMGEENPEWATFLGRNLFENESFQNQFAERFEYHLNHKLHRDSLAPKVCYLKSLFEPQVQPLIDRFDLTNTYDGWLYDVEELYKFLSYRPCSIQEEIQDLFGIEMNIDSCEAVIINEGETPNFCARYEPGYMEEVDSMITNVNELFEETSHFFVLTEGNQIFINCSSCADSQWELRLFDMQGKLMKETMPVFTDGLTSIGGLESLPNGMYLFSMNNGQERIQRKINLLR